MGHSMYDPGAEDRRPWNAGRKIGAQLALKPQQIWAARFNLDRELRLRDRVKIKIRDLLASGRTPVRAVL
jgi:hypothetical protein